MKVHSRGCYQFLMNFFSLPLSVCVSRSSSSPVPTTNFSFSPTFTSSFHRFLIPVKTHSETHRNPFPSEPSPPADSPDLSPSTSTSSPAPSSAGRGRVQVSGSRRRHNRAGGAPGSALRSSSHPPFLACFLYAPLQTQKPSKKKKKNRALQREREREREKGRAWRKKSGAPSQTQ
jgi:hypothetical protein